MNHSLEFFCAFHSLAIHQHWMLPDTKDQDQEKYCLRSFQCKISQVCQLGNLALDVRGLRHPPYLVLGHVKSQPPNRVVLNLILFITNCQLESQKNCLAFTKGIRLPHTCHWKWCSGKELTKWTWSIPTAYCFGPLQGALLSETKLLWKVRSVWAPLCCWVWCWGSSIIWNA